MKIRILQILILILLVFPSQASFYIAYSQEIEKGINRNDLALVTMDGKEAKLSNYLGKTLVIVFWAFWCDTWKNVVEGYEYLSRDMLGVPFEFIVIAIDPLMPDEENIKTRLNSIPFPILIDQNGAVSAAYRIKAVPTIIIMDKDGKIKFRHEGYPGNKKLKEVIWLVITGEKKECDNRSQGH